MLEFEVQCASIGISESLIVISTQQASSGSLGLKTLILGGFSGNCELIDTSTSYIAEITFLENIVPFIFLKSFVNPKLGFFSFRISFSLRRVAIAFSFFCLI